ncbi:MAG: hypothetical protein EOP84_16050, partial [Verrucomicrobiaceae bacterium]
MKHLPFILFSSAAALLISPRASAEVYTWQTADPATNVWSTNAADANWYLGANTVLTPWADGNDAVFAGTGETIAVTGTLTPLSTTVGAGDGNWTLTGAGVIGGTLVKEGSGTLTFGTGGSPYTGANTFTSTTINGGIVSIGSGGTGAATSNVNALGTGAITINNGTLRLWIQNSATSTFTNNLTINGGTVLGEDGINIMSGTVNVGAGGATFSSKWDGKTLTFSNVISGSGPVTVQRAPSNHTGPAVIMTAKNTYTGGTTVNSGILQLGTDVATQAGSVGIIVGDVTINSGATLRLSNINAFGYGGGTKVNTVNINGGTLLHEANGDNGWGVTYNLTGGTMRSTSATGNFSFGGGTSVKTLEAAGSSVIDGTVILREGNATPQVVFNTADGAALNDLVVNATLSDNNGARGIQKDGAGTMLLNGNSTYTGATIVNGGTLALGAFAQMSSSPITVNNGGTFRVDATGKFLSTITANNGATLGLIAKAGETTNVFNMLTLGDGGSISVAPSFASRPIANQTFTLLSAVGVTGTSTIT